MLLAGCTASGTSELVGVLPEGDGFDYQLGGAYAADVAVVVRDAKAAPLPGAFSICYVNGFQTQPGQEEMWETSPELLSDAAGEAVVDPDWPYERILDPTTPERRDAILDLLGPVVDGCAAAGFDAVEIDNLDVATRIPGLEEEPVLSLAEAGIGFREVRMMPERTGWTILRDRALAGLGEPGYVFEAC